MGPFSYVRTRLVQVSGRPLEKDLENPVAALASVVKKMEPTQAETLRAYCTAIFDVNRRCVRREFGFV